MVFKLSDEKKKARATLRSRPSIEIQRKVLELNAKLKVEKRLAKKRYFENRFDQCDSREKWSELNKLLGRKRDKPKVPLIERGGREICDPVTIGNELNDHFTNIGLHIQSSNSSISTNAPPAQIWNSRSMLLFETDETDETEVNYLIKSLELNKAVGYDHISNNILKRSSAFITWPLTICINKTLSTGIYPDALKVARVLPIFKGRNTRMCDNYRPISILCGLDKIFEQVMQKRLQSFLEQENFLCQTQFGFRRGSGTTNACLEAVDYIHRELDKKNVRIVSGLSLDLTKAFDSISHKILLRKLYTIGIRGLAHKLFESYLTDRKQFVDLNGFHSEMRFARSGVPQGSVLGPILFLIFLNDIGKLKLHGEIFLYADDSAIFYSGRRGQDENES